jgi:GTPase
MIPVIALVGRPNVGKSTLFNRLTRSRDALVADRPGLTRDRKYGDGKVGGRAYLVIDTGGLSEQQDALDRLMAHQAELAIEEADVTLFLVDAREGVTAADQSIAERLRRTGKPVRLVVNKTEGLEPATACAEFHLLGLGEPFAVSAAHGQGIERLMGATLALLPAPEPEPEAASTEAGEAPIRIAFAGRPNVGKSTLVNRMLGEERVLAYDRPGTTRDAIEVPFERDGTKYVLIDTAGVRRRARVTEVVEKFSIVKTLQAIEAANVVVVVLDAQEGITERDAGLVGFVVDAGRALVLAVNKWDGLAPEQRTKVRRELDVKLPFIGFARIHFISALHGSGVGDLYRSIDEAYDSATRKLATPQLTRILEQAVEQNQPPMVRGRRIKLRYAHQGGENPPAIVIHGNQTEHVPDAYRRYLANTFRTALKLRGTPLRIDFRTGANPYEGRRNLPTERQIQRRKRLMRHVKKK